MYCSECGAKLVSGSRFCSDCGIKVDNVQLGNDGVEAAMEDMVEANESQSANDYLFEKAKSIANELILRGLLYVVIGIVVTSISYAVGFGGMYVICWGAILWGVIDMIRGCYYRLFPKNLVKKVIKKIQEEIDQE